MDPRDLVAHLRFYQELGVTGISRDAAWRQRAPAAPAAEQRPETLVEVVTREDAMIAPAIASVTPEPVVLLRSPAEVLVSIRADIGDCTRCKLHALGRQQIVFGVGNDRAALMFVGEAPGGDEDVQGIPFVGRAGQLLTKIIEAIGLGREEVYIANVIKCRPPGNRNPEPDEVQTCEPFLFRQIEAIAPKVIVALGNFPVKTLLKTNEPISRLRGRIFDFRGAKLIPTYHPAYLLRSPDKKRDVWDDMKKVRSLLQDPAAAE